MAQIIDLDTMQLVISNQGPTENQYEEVNAWFDQLESLAKEYGEDQEELIIVKETFQELFNNKEAMFGHVLNWPHGYPGDYEIIDRIYKTSISQNPKYKKWDEWFHVQPATQAVRNRKTYFKQLVAEKASKGGHLKVLNLASGPCRDLLEFFEENPDTNVQFDCIEIDPNAVVFARELLGVHKDKVKFHLANIFKYDTLEQYDLIWSAGLFDYFDDKTFVTVLKRYKHNLNPGGEIVVGNFYIHNPTRIVMSFFGWNLNHRTYDELLDMAEKAGYSPGKMRVESEPLGVNLFMRIAG